MKVVNKAESAQVISMEGRLIRAFPDQQQAEAFMQGYAAGVKDVGEVVRNLLVETLAVMEGETR